MKKENKNIEDALEEAIFNPDFIIPLIIPNSKITLPDTDKTNLLHLERKIKKNLA